MNEQFLNLSKDKQLRILKAALVEFAKQGYENASTNQIVKDAGIGKGMLFYYFNSKQELYEDLVGYSLSVIQTNYIDLIKDDRSDIIEWMHEVARLKMNYFLQYPEVNNFLSRLLTFDEIPERFMPQIEKLFKRGSSILVHKIDASKERFRNDIDPNDAVKLFTYMIKGYQQDILERMKGKKLSDVDLKALWDEFYRFLEIIKQVFYK